MKASVAVALKLAAIIVLSFAVALTSIAQTFVMSAGTATSVGIASAAQYQILSDAQWLDYENVITTAVLNETTKLAVNSGQPLSSAGYSSIASAVRAQLDANAPSAALFQRMDVAGRLRYGIDSLASLASSQQASPVFPKALFEVEKAKFMLLENSVDPSRQQPADLALYTLTSNALQFIADQVQQASDLAHNDSQYAAAVNPVLQSLTTFDSSNSYAEIQAGYGVALPTLPPANSDGSYTLNEQDLVSQYQSAVGTVQAIADADLSALEASNSSSGQMQVSRTKALSRTGSIRAEDDPGNGGTQGCGKGGDDGGSGSGSQNPCQIAQSDVTGLSKLVGLFDSGLGTQMAAVGGAGIQAGLAIDQLVTGAVSGFAALGPVGSIIGAGVSVFSSVFGGGSNANAAVLKQIQKLSQQIARLQADMDAQFAKTDALLNTVLTTLNQNFALIDYELGTLNGSAQEIKNALLDVQTQLDGMEYYNLAYQQAEEADALMLSVNACLNYAATHDGQDIGSAQFDNCVNTFFTWAQTNSLDAIWAPVPPIYTDPAIFNYFQNFANSGVCLGGCQTPFAVTVDGLINIATQNLGQPSPSPVPVPNADEWTLGTRMHLTMGHQWPQYSNGLSTSYLNQLIQIGTSLQQAAQNITTNRPSGGPISVNPALFNALTAKYSSSVAQLQNSAYARVNTFLSNPNNGLTNKGVTLSLWAGGVNQATNLRPSIPSIKRCDNSGPALAAPSNLLGYVPSLYAADEFYHNVTPGIEMCIASTSWVNEEVLWKPPDPTSCKVITNPRSGSQSCTTGCVGPVAATRTTPVTCYPSEKRTDAHVQVAINLSYQGTVVTTAVAQSSIVTEESDETFVKSLPCGREGDTCETYDPQTTTIDLAEIVNTQWTSLLDLQSALNTSSQITQVPQPGLDGEIGAQFDSDLAGFQQSIYGMIASDLNSPGTALQASCQQLWEDKILFQAYTNFGLQNSLQSDAILRGFLYGNQAIYDCPAVQSDFASFSTAPVADTTEDKITDEANAMNGGLAGLAAEINSALAAIQSTQLPPSLPQIDTTLEDLQAFVNLQNAGALTPCNFQLSSGFASIGAGGGSGTITVQELSGCSWTASTNADWLTFPAGSSGSGNGSVTFFAGPNFGTSPQDAIIILGDQLFRVTELGGDVAPFPVLSPTTLQFGNQPVGTTSAPMTVTVSNTGTAPLNFASIGASGDFAVAGSGTTCSVGSPLPPNNSCVVSITFTPTATGSRMGSLNLTDNANPNIQSIALNGVGSIPLPAFQQVPGDLAQISVGSQSSVWGINGTGAIFWFNPQSQSWKQIEGQLVQIAVASDGAVWGLNADQQIFRFNPQTGGWDHIPGALAQIAVGSAGVIWGINSAQQIFRFDSGTQSWEQIPGALTEIAAGADGSVWGINSAQQIFTFNPQTQSWSQIPGLLTQIAIGSANAVWGINSAQQIFHYNPQTQNWNQIRGALTQIAVGANGSVWGINSAQQIFHYNLQTQNWVQIPGALTQLAVGVDGAMWGINAQQQVYELNVQPSRARSWVQVPGQLTQVSVGVDGTVWGLNAAQEIYTFNPQAQAWTQVPGSLTQIAVDFGGAVWGLNAAHEIYTFNPQTQAWQQIPGSLTQIAVGSANSVWGINAVGQIFRFNPRSQDYWDLIPGQLTQIAVAFDGTVWGINAAQQIYTFNGSTQSWIQVPGSLAQIAVGSANSVWGINAAGAIFRFNPQSQDFWDLIPGQLTQIAVAFDGTVWGINSAQETYTFNPQTQSWNQIPGLLTQIAVGSDGAVWAINSSQEVFRLE